MKIGISSTGQTLADLLDPRFGRCEYFQIYDTNTQLISAVRNRGQEASGGAGISASNQLAEESVDIIITGSLGPNAFEIIQKSGIKAYSCQPIPVSEALKKFEAGDLKLIDISGPAHKGMR